MADRIEADYKAVFGSERGARVLEHLKRVFGYGDCPFALAKRPDAPGEAVGQSAEIIAGAHRPMRFIDMQLLRADVEAKKDKPTTASR